MKATIIFCWSMMLGVCSASISVTFVSANRGGDDYFVGSCSGGGLNSFGGLGSAVAVMASSGTVGLQDNHCGSDCVGSGPGPYVLVQWSGCTVTAVSGATAPQQTATVVATFTNNSSVPVAFEVLGSNGEPLQAPGVLTVGQVLGVTNLPAGATLGFIPVAQSSLQTNGASIFDTALNADTFVYNNNAAFDVGGGLATNTSWGFSSSSAPFGTTDASGTVTSPVLSALQSVASSGGSTTNVGVAWTNGLTLMQLTNQLALQMASLGWTNDNGTASSNQMMSAFGSISNAWNVATAPISNMYAALQANRAMEDAATNWDDATFGGAVTNPLNMNFYAYNNGVSLGTPFMAVDINIRHTEYYGDLTLVVRALVVLITSMMFLRKVYLDTEAVAVVWNMTGQWYGHNKVSATPLGVGVQSDEPSLVANIALGVTLMLAAPLLLAGAISVLFGGDLGVLGFTPVGVMENLVSSMAVDHQGWAQYAILIIYDILPITFLMTLLVEYGVWTLFRGTTMQVVAVCLRALPF